MLYNQRMALTQARNIITYGIGAFFIFGFVTFAMLGLSTLVCQQSVRRCVIGDNCPNNTICVDYGKGRLRCSPKFCPVADTYKKRVLEFLAATGTNIRSALVNVRGSLVR